ncbi:hypothetical protein WJX84_009242 [Apatococcus fuscideae]|uniref:Uncharacterized protein n=1 Tax=Apatococcus fuscideae TaxID=2026836 RepID=A0AAW1SYT1_9CHLO
MVRNRSLTRWGDHSTTAVVRSMIQEALINPLNEKFMLLSETCVPLYPPQVIHMQLIQEPKSRINACDKEGWQRNFGRFWPQMENAMLKPHHWRKHWQWFALTRQHAELVENDTSVEPSFAQHCAFAIDDTIGEWRTCFSDEHYISTLLAVHGLDDETDCDGFVTHADWEHITDIMHPRTYSIWETTPELLKQLRLPHHGCEANFAAHAASSLYARSTDIEHGILSQLTQRTLAAQTDKALNYGCPLFARKFPVETADLVYKILTADHCHGLQILKPEVHPTPISPCSRFPLQSFLEI